MPTLAFRRRRAVSVTVTATLSVLEQDTLGRHAGRFYGMPR